MALSSAKNSAGSNQSRTWFVSISFANHSEIAAAPIGATTIQKTNLSIEGWCPIRVEVLRFAYGTEASGFESSRARCFTSDLGWAGAPATRRPKV
ncbi:MAG: hypothetical protein AVDCRST_MAG85-2675 [uncultured Solirubrobacteraceae bacterium]|uniref:Uncharacterized protein n=1 Tax=uncultured Solirubrobacteraceae bacterium TaxID=1162706 RepID=A0A6J4T9I8_9ACTN|nr:MAG: hypothetical protein AVDCRST_MAG85-2675 [uncultured Solirubrobacteraceae bacterium]